jgi:L,D-transpeptidase ErfK/SrfK
MTHFIRQFFIILCLTTSVAAQAEVFAWDKNSDVIGQIQIILADPSVNFAQLAEKYNVAFSALVESNPGVDPWAPAKGVELIIPTQFVLPSGPRSGIVINTAEFRLYYFDEKNKLIYSYPSGIGRPDWPTPLGSAKITGKIVNPSWTVPESILAEAFEKKIDITPVVPPGPDNPLGDHALRLSMPSILIHGTNNPAGVGRRVTHGCMRLYPKDVADLFGMVQNGTEVRIVHEPVKAGWRGGDLFVEMHPALPEYAEPLNKAMEHAAQVISNNAKALNLNLDWSLISSMAKAGTGVPTLVASSRSQNLNDLRRQLSIDAHKMSIEGGYQNPDNTVVQDVPLSEKNSKPKVGVQRS